MRSVSIPDIISYLNTQPTVTALLGNRIFFGEPVKDEQAGIYLVMNVITEARNEVDCMARVNFQFCAHTQNVTRTQLIAALDAVSRVLCVGPKKYGAFETYAIEEGSDFLTVRDDKNRNLLTRDFYVRFIWSN